MQVWQSNYDQPVTLRNKKKYNGTNKSGKGSSQKGGIYINSSTRNRYGKHK